MQRILSRLREPSSWAAVSALALLVGVSPVQVDAISALVSAVAGAVAVFLPERKA